MNEQRLHHNNSVQKSIKLPNILDTKKRLRHEGLEFVYLFKCYWLIYDLQVGYTYNKHLRWDSGVYVIMMKHKLSDETK